MEDRVPITLKIQPVLRILPIRKLQQEEQRMQRHTGRGTEESGKGFSNLLEAERSRLEQEETGKIGYSSRYGRDAREITEYESHYDFRG